LHHAEHDLARNITFLRPARLAQFASANLTIAFRPNRRQIVEHDRQFLINLQPVTAELGWPSGLNIDKDL
jgi:hypothetical protein